MSVVGFDFGNESGVVAVARQRGIDVVLNDESKRETPAVVCFGEKQRFLGTAGAASSLMNPKNTISQIKRLIGRAFSDPELQRDLKALPFNVIEGPDGFPLIQARYLGEIRTFTPTQVLGMVLSDLKNIAEKNLNTAVVDCCIGIPVYFTDLQRRAVVDAATVAGLHPLRLIHETTATALAYGIYKTDLPENDQLNVAFVDIGHASMQVSIAGFKKGQLKILAHSFDRSLGGRDFDEVLFHHFAAKFKEEYKIDVYQNARACLRLRSGCEKLKKILSANPEAPLNVECLMDEKDVRGFIKREEFEKISTPILERVKKPLEKALAEAGLVTENIHSVEVVGSGSRVPAVIKILTEFFGKEPRRTMNASECVAKGAALECAILSPTFKVREFQVNDVFPFPIALSWKGSTPNSQNGVFSKGNSIPSVKALTVCRSGTFTVDVQYADVSELQVPAKISTYTIGPFQATKGGLAKVKVTACLNLHGIVSVESATLLEEEEVDVPVVKEAAKESSKMETDEASSDCAPPSSTENDVHTHDSKGTADASGAERWSKLRSLALLILGEGFRFSRVVDEKRVGMRDEVKRPRMVVVEDAGRLRDKYDQLIEGSKTTVADAKCLFMTGQFRPIEGRGDVAALFFGLICIDATEIVVGVRTEDVSQFNHIKADVKGCLGFDISPSDLYKIKIKKYGDKTSGVETCSETGDEIVDEDGDEIYVDMGDKAYTINALKVADYKTYGYYPSAQRLSLKESLDRGRLLMSDEEKVNITDGDEQGDENGHDTYVDIGMYAINNLEVSGYGHYPSPVESSLDEAANKMSVLEAEQDEIQMNTTKLEFDITQQKRWLNLRDYRIRSLEKKLLRF